MVSLMLRWRVKSAAMVWLALLALPVLAPAKSETMSVPPTDEPRLLPRIAIVIDDLGHHQDHFAFSELSIPLTLAIMPFTPKAEALAQHASTSGHEVVIHMPMQAAHHAHQQQGVLDRFDTKAQFIATLDAAFSRLPQATGLNNHQGSLMTAAAEQMLWLMDELKQRSLYFLDSRTSVETVAEATARESAVPTNRRHVFLDNESSAEAIAQQWQRALSIAEDQGYAIVIGHPYPATLEFLKTLERADDTTVALVHLSELIIASPR